MLRLDSLFVRPPPSALRRSHRCSWISFPDIPWLPKVMSLVSVGNDTYGITGIPTTVAGRGDREKSRTSRQHKEDLPRFGLQRCVKPYDPALVDVFSVIELLN